MKCGVMNDLFGKELAGRPMVYMSRLNKPNPMVALFGFGPINKRCKHCVHLLGFKQSTSWFKCKLRRMSASQATDHRANWESCGKFEEI